MNNARRGRWILLTMMLLATIVPQGEVMKNTKTFILEGPSGKPVILTVVAGIIAEGSHGFAVLDEQQNIVAL